LKQYRAIGESAKWANPVTRCGDEEIVEFIERGGRNHLIIDGQPNVEAFRAADTEQGGGDIALTLIYPAHPIIRNSFGSMMRKLSVTASQ
jgi:hypothetical protein